MKEAIVFTTSTCMPCKAYKSSTVEPMIEEGYDIKIVDAVEDQESAMKYMVRAVPTTVVLEDGAVVETFTGAKTMNQMKKILA